MHHIAQSKDETNLEETEDLDGAVGVEGEAVVDASGEDEQVGGLDADANPVVRRDFCQGRRDQDLAHISSPTIIGMQRTPDVEVASSLEDVADFLVFVDVSSLVENRNQ